MLKILEPFWNRASLGCRAAPLKKVSRISKSHSKNWILRNFHFMNVTLHNFKFAQNCHPGKVEFMWLLCVRDSFDITRLKIVYLRIHDILLIFEWKNSSYTCFYRKRDSTASSVADDIWPQHFEENLVLNPKLSKFWVPEQHLILFYSPMQHFFM